MVNFICQIKKLTNTVPLIYLILKTNKNKIKILKINKKKKFNLLFQFLSCLIFFSTLFRNMHL